MRTLRVVLASVARTHELVLGLVPRNDATQVSADGIQTIVLQLVLIIDDQIGSITLQTLHQRPEENENDSKNSLKIIFKVHLSLAKWFCNQSP
jgi:hypothetical protein